MSRLTDDAVRDESHVHCLSGAHAPCELVSSMVATKALGGGVNRILVVDDYPDTVEAVCMMLAILGHVPLGAVSGAEALAQVERFEPAIVFVDLNLPDIDGYEVMRRIRERRRTAPRLVALTGSILHKRSSVVESGFDDYLLKPAGVTAMRRLLDTHLPPRRSRQLSLAMHGSLG